MVNVRAQTSWVVEVILDRCKMVVRGRHTAVFTQNLHYAPKCNTQQSTNNLSCVSPPLSRFRFFHLDFILTPIAYSETVIRDTWYTLYFSHRERHSATTTAIETLNAQPRFTKPQPQLKFKISTPWRRYKRYAAATLRDTLYRLYNSYYKISPRWGCSLILILHHFFFVRMNIAAIL